MTHPTENHDCTICGRPLEEHIGVSLPCPVQPGNYNSQERGSDPVREVFPLQRSCRGCDHRIEPHWLFCAWCGFVVEADGAPRVVSGNDIQMFVNRHNAKLRQPAITVKVDGVLYHCNGAEWDGNRFVTGPFDTAPVFFIVPIRGSRVTLT